MLGVKKKIFVAVKRVGVSPCCDEIKFLSKSFLHQSNFEKLKKCISTIFFCSKKTKRGKNPKCQKIKNWSFDIFIFDFRLFWNLLILVAFVMLDKSLIKDNGFPYYRFHFFFLCVFLSSKGWTRMMPNDVRMSILFI